MKKGREIIREEHASGCNTVGFGEMGIGNTSAASLLMHKYTGLSVEACTGVGTGHDDKGLQKKIAILETVSNKHDANTEMETLATFGGLEIAMMTGAMLEAKEKNMLMLVDGFISTAAMLAAHEMDNTILQNTIFCHSSSEKGHEKMLGYLGASPLLNLNMRLGEGSGAAVALPIVQSAVAFLNEMASFEDAGVTNKG
jgi:nicotinate-nucleotide--dimethylbenzimidazole phosphoribosyltransferase